MFLTKVVEKIKKKVFNNLFPKIAPFTR